MRETRSLLAGVRSTAPTIPAMPHIGRAPTRKAEARRRLRRRLCERLPAETAREVGSMPRGFGRLGDRCRSPVTVLNRQHLLLDPGIRSRNSVVQGEPRLPPERIDLFVTEISGLYAHRPCYVLGVHVLPCHVRNRVDQLLHGHILRQSDVGGSLEIRVHEPANTVDHIIDVRVGTNCAAIAPYLDRAAVSDLGDFAADRSRSLLPAPRPG